METGYVIAIDGPSGAGKSTVARDLAKRLGYRYIDTGAMYRAAGLAAARQGVDIKNPAELEKFLSGLVIRQEMVENTVITLLGEEDVSREIRKPEMGLVASEISALPPVREKLTQLQREMGRAGRVVMEGRDIGTVVFPDADFKFFLTASAEERAGRRHKELIEKGEEVSYEEVLADMKKRDHNDSTRETAPLRKLPDAREIDSTGRPAARVIEEMARMVERGGDGEN